MEAYSTVETFFLYASVFSVAGWFAWLHERKKHILFGVLAIALPAIFSGARGGGVGEDTLRYLGGLSVYAESVFQLPWQDGWQYHSSEYGYYLLAWLSSNLFVNITFSFCLIYGVLLALAYFGCRNISMCKEMSSLLRPDSGGKIQIQSSAWVGYTVYLFALLIPSYNLLRQSLSICILFFSIRYIFNRNIFKYISILAVAISFHFSALFAFIWFWFCGNYRYKFLKPTVILIGGALLPLAFLYLSGILGYDNKVHFGNAALGGVLVLFLLIPLLLCRRSRFSEFAIVMNLLTVYTVVLACFLAGFNRFFYLQEILVPVSGIFLASGRKKIIRQLWWWFFFFYVVGYRFIYSQILSGTGFYFEWVK